MEGGRNSERERELGGSGQSNLCKRVKLIKKVNLRDRESSSEFHGRTALSVCTTLATVMIVSVHHFFPVAEKIMSESTARTTTLA